MDLSKPLKSDPLPLLLNEIEILVAQSRLVELYLKQSHAAALFEKQRAREQHEAELANLRAVFSQREQTLTVSQDAANNRERALCDQVQRFELAWSEIQGEMKERAAALNVAEAVAAELRQRLSQSESNANYAQSMVQRAQAAQRELENQIIALTARLEDGQQTLQIQQRAGRELSEKQQAQILQLQAELREKVDRAAAAEKELQQNRSASEEAQGRIAELEAIRDRERTQLAQALEQSRAHFAAESERLQSALTTREKTIEEIRQSAGAAEHYFRNEILTLRGELEERQKLVDGRDEALRGTRAELAALQERTETLAQAKADEMASLRRSYESDLANLQHEVERRERALTERQEAVSAVELALHAKIQVLQGELARSRGAIAEHESAVQQAQGEILALRKQLEREQAAASENLVTRQHADERQRGLETELSRLQQELTEKESWLAQNESQRAMLEANLRAENQGLQNALAEQRSLAAGADAALARARAEIVAIEEQRSRLEQSQSEFEELRRQEALIRQELESRLQAKDEELRAFHDHGREQTASALKEQEERFKNLEGERLREIARLKDQVQGREFAEQQSHAEIVRLCGEIADLEDQRRAWENSPAELRRQLEQANTSRSELEARLQSSEIDRENQLADLRRRLDEENSRGEILGTKFDHLRAEQADAEEKIRFAEQVRSDLEQNYQSALALQQENAARLQAKELELENTQADLHVLRQQLEEKISRLQLELAEKQLLVESRATEIVDLKDALGRASAALAETESATNALAQSQDDLERLRAEHRTALDALSAEREKERQKHEREITEERRRASEAAENIGAATERARELSVGFEERHRELEAAAAERAVLRSRLDDLHARYSELAAKTHAQEELRTKLETDLTAARNELEQKIWASAQHQAALENLALTHKDHIEKLESRIAEEQNNAREHELEAERFQSQVRLRDERVQELTAELRQTERTAVDRAVQIKDDYGLRIADLERQIAQKTSELQARGEMQPVGDQALRRELDRLVHEIQERNQILQDRNDELVRVKADADELRERFSRVEAEAAEVESGFQSESERMRVEFQAQIALLQAELSQKEWADAERQAETRGLEENYRREIETLREKLAERETATHNDVFDEKPGEISPAGFSELDKNGHGPAVSSSGRWQGGFGWKRRWKSS